MTSHSFAFNNKFVIDISHLPAVTTLAAPIFIVAVAWEWWAVKTGRANGAYETKDAISSLTMGLGNVAINTLTAMTFTWMMSLAWPYRFFELEVTWWSGLLCFVLYDFIYYWKHRLAHRARWWWMEHITHHSSRHYNFTTALRQPWFGPFTGLTLLGVPLSLLGFHPALVIMIGGLNLIYQFWVHTETVNKLPRWIEAVFNTPSHHRVHHAINPRYLDTNFGGVFIIFDKWFGTFEPEREDEPPTYGIVKQLGSYNPLTIAYHEVIALIKDFASDGLRPWRWVARLVNPPGWSPDGNHMRSKEIKAAWRAEASKESPQTDPATAD